MALQLGGSSVQDSAVLQIVNKLSAKAASVALDSEGPLLVKADGQQVRGVADIVQALASPALLGADAEEAKQVGTWVDFAHSHLSSAQVSGDAVQHLNNWLARRSFLAANRLTLADIVVYVYIAPFVQASLKNQTNSAPHIVRWFDLIQHQPAVTGQFPLVSFKLSNLEAFVLPEFDFKEELKVEAVAEAAPAAAAAAVAPAAAPAAQAPAKEGKKKEKKEEKKEEKKQEQKEEGAGEGEDIRRLDIRVGKIVSVENHPTADTLYVEQIDIGDRTVTVVSGLRKWVPIEQMLNRSVVLLVNLKPAPVRDVMSHGLVLCASTEQQVEPLVPPADAPAGTPISFSGVVQEPDNPVNPKKLHKILKDLHTSDAGVAQYKNLDFTTTFGVVVAPSMKNTPVK
eukprot:TRINITY_DN167_c0_g5_i1.p1 TRINITY_DN167_c0_g5~~TRINITY_DN167_c0_g5_i1.p1  ORF type:complete len:398 (-),score=191.99 TRINITY_DN167_c0_g5_i1:48-1241(-)